MRTQNVPGLSAGSNLIQIVLLNCGVVYTALYTLSQSIRPSYIYAEKVQDELLYTSFESANTYGACRKIIHVFQSHDDMVHKPLV